MKSAMRALLGVVAGMALAMALVVAVEMFSNVVHPYPADFDGNIPEHVKRYPPWVLAVAVLMWGATAGIAVWVASKIGKLTAGVIVALLLAWALIFNLTHLPYYTWFKVTMPIAFVIACLIGLKYGKPASSPGTRSDSPAPSR